MKYMMIFITVLVLSSCRSDKTNTESSSSFIYDISTLTIALSHEYLTPAEGYFTHIDTHSVAQTLLQKESGGDLFLASTDQMSLISPYGTIAHGENYNESTLGGSHLACCSFTINLPENNINFDKVKKLLDDNIWKVVFKRHGIIEDSFSIAYPAPVAITKMHKLFVLSDQDFTLTWSDSNSAGSVDGTIYSKCFDNDQVRFDTVSFEADTHNLSIPLSNTDGCSDHEASINIRFIFEAKANNTTDLLNAPLRGIPFFLQFFDLPLKIN